MNNLFNNIRSWIRHFLLKLARDLKPSKLKESTIIESGKLFQREIKIPAFISWFVTIVIVYAMLVMGTKINTRLMFATAVFVAILIIFFIARVKNKEKIILEDNDAVVLMCLLFISALLTLQIAKEYFSPFVSPVSAFSIMAAMLLSTRLGGVYAVCLSLCVAFLNDMHFDLFITMLGSTAFVIASANSIRKRSDFINVGVKTVIVSIVLLSMFYLFGSYNIFHFRYNIFNSILNGIFSIVILLVFMPLFEKIFSRTTNIKLI
jgi:membrane-associated HD superfamily phosphohydrolase